jgi:hypothetical protein
VHKSFGIYSLGFITAKAHFDVLPIDAKENEFCVRSKRGNPSRSRISFFLKTKAIGTKLEPPLFTTTTAERSNRAKSRCAFFSFIESHCFRRFVNQSGFGVP